MATPDTRRQGDEKGFTLIELMVVVLIIAILLAIAVPAFFGARQRASDRATQTNVRTAHVAELVHYSDNQQFTEDTTVLAGVEANVGYTNDLTALVNQGKVVYVAVLPSSPPLNIVVVGGRSSSGSCFWIRAIGGTNAPRFADNDCTTIPDPSTFREEW